MRSKCLKFLIMVMAVALCSSAGMAASLGTVKGRIVDSEGAVIKGAHLLFHPDSSGEAKPATRSDVMRESDGSGQFEVHN
jgi:hypothetical protein